jgi:hypothetical protein
MSSFIHIGRKNPSKTSRFHNSPMALRLLLESMSGGYSGPASRSGVPLEHPPFQ